MMDLGISDEVRQDILKALSQEIRRLSMTDKLLDTSREASRLMRIWHRRGLNPPDAVLDRFVAFIEEGDSLPGRNIRRHIIPLLKM